MKVLLKELLKEKGHSQYWLCKATGMTMAAASQLCNNKTSRIQFDVLERICIALECEPSDLFEVDHTKKADFN